MTKQHLLAYCFSCFFALVLLASIIYTSLLASSGQLEVSELSAAERTITSCIDLSNVPKALEGKDALSNDNDIVSVQNLQHSSILSLIAVPNSFSSLLDTQDSIFYPVLGATSLIFASVIIWCYYPRQVPWYSKRKVLLFILVISVIISASLYFYFNNITTAPTTPTAIPQEEDGPLLRMISDYPIFSLFAFIFFLYSFAYC